MVVEVQTQKVTGAGSGSGFVYSFSPLVINKSSEIVVTHVVNATGVETLLTEGVGASNYSVTVSLYPGTGSVTYPADEGTSMPSGESIVMKRVLVLEQQTNLESQGGYDPEVQEDQFDKFVMIDLQQQEELDRSFRWPVSYPGTISNEFPNPVGEGGKFLKINSAENAFEYVSSVTLGTAVLSDTTPQAPTASGAAGTSSDVSRADHAHPEQDLSTYLENISEDVTPQLGGPLDTNGKSINESEGDAVASATTTDIFGGDDGNTLHITGTTTIVDFTDASGVGQWRKIIFDGVLTLTHGSGITLPGSANITTAAGDYAFVYADAVDAFTVLYFKADGSSVVAAGGGKVIQMVSVVDGAVATGTTALPVDDTIPQNTEGDEYMTLAITPTDAANKLVICATGYLSTSDTGGAAVTMALFQDSTANALAVGCKDSNGTGERNFITFTHVMTAGTTNLTTFKIRGGYITTATVTFNGSGGVRQFGGVCASSIVIMEIEP